MTTRVNLDKYDAFIPILCVLLGRIMLKFPEAQIKSAFRYLQGISRKLYLGGT